MKSYSVVILNPREKDTLKKVLPSIGIGFPDYHARGDGSMTPAKRTDREDRVVRALNGVAKSGVDLTHENITLAIEALLQQIAVCSLEAQEEYWLKNALTPEGRAALARGELVSSPLIADARVMIDMLVTTRGIQLREAQDALHVLDKARLLASPKPDVDDEEW